MARHAPVFREKAAAAGIALLANVKLPWLTRNGHLAAHVSERLPAATSDALDRILDVLGGDPQALAGKTRGAMRADFTLGDVHVEYDEVQHFTSARSSTFAFYPRAAVVAFDIDEYAAAAAAWAPKGDRGFAHRTAAEFPGAHSRQRQRAYFDAFRDLAAVHFGNGPIIRIAAPENDYDRAVATLCRITATRSV